MRCPSCTNINPHDSLRCQRCGTSLRESDLEIHGRLLEPGEVVDGRFRIVGLIGAGAMGTAYEAFHTRLRRSTALKVLNPELLSHSTARSRMEHEAVALAAIRHPNVVEIHDVFDWEGLLVLDLELVRGGTLAGKMRQVGRLPLKDALSTMTSILNGLQAIHDAKLVHRDLKPSNILLTEDGQPKIADLGVAHDLEGRGRTKTGTRIGTPEYMSPEQVRGQKVGYPTDIYSCGIILYELLAGRTPFDADSEFDVMKGHVELEPDIGALGSEVPKGVEEALRKALAKDPGARWQQASELRAALEARQIQDESTAEELEPPAAQAAFKGSSAGMVGTHVPGAAHPAVAPEPPQSPRVAGSAGVQTNLGAQVSTLVPERVERAKESMPRVLGATVVGLLVVVAIVALAVWSDTQKALGEAAAASEPPEIEAGPEGGPDASKKVGTSGPSLCAGPCNGNAPPSLRSALSSTAGAARGCYERALRTNSMLEGRMMVAVRVASNGNVCSASVVQDSVGSPQVTSCVTSLFSGKRFPPVTDGRCADVQVPLSFKPRENN